SRPSTTPTAITTGGSAPRSTSRHPSRRAPRSCGSPRCCASELRPVARGVGRPVSVVAAAVHNGAMATHLAFLRAINLGAKRVFPKADIQRVVASVGFEDVATHINTGNVRFTTRMRSRPRIEAALEQAFAADRGFEVPAITFDATEFADLAAEAQQINAEHPGLARHYVYLLKAPL